MRSAFFEVYNGVDYIQSNLTLAISTIFKMVDYDKENGYKGRPDMRTYINMPEVVFFALRNTLDKTPVSKININFSDFPIFCNKLVAAYEKIKDNPTIFDSNISFSVILNDKVYSFLPRKRDKDGSLRKVVILNVKDVNSSLLFTTSFSFNGFTSFTNMCKQFIDSFQVIRMNALNIICMKNLIKSNTELQGFMEYQKQVKSVHDFNSSIEMSVRQKEKDINNAMQTDETFTKTKIKSKEDVDKVKSSFQNTMSAVVENNKTAESNTKKLANQLEALKFNLKEKLLSTNELHDDNTKLLSALYEIKTYMIGLYGITFASMYMNNSMKFKDFEITMTKNLKIYKETYGDKIDCRGILFIKPSDNPVVLNEVVSHNTFKLIDLYFLYKKNNDNEMVKIFKLIIIPLLSAILYKLSGVTTSGLGLNNSSDVEKLLKISLAVKVGFDKYKEKVINPFYDQFSFLGDAINSVSGEIDMEVSPEVEECYEQESHGIDIQESEIEDAEFEDVEDVEFEMEENIKNKEVAFEGAINTEAELLPSDKNISVLVEYFDKETKYLDLTKKNEIRDKLLIADDFMDISLAEEEAREFCYNYPLTTVLSLLCWDKSAIENIKVLVKKIKEYKDGLGDTDEANIRNNAFSVISSI